MIVLMTDIYFLLISNINLFYCQPESISISVTKIQCCFQSDLPYKCWEVKFKRLYIMIFCIKLLDTVKHILNDQNKCQQLSSKIIRSFP